MVAAGLYNALDFRSMCGRSRTHDVHECNYAQIGNAMGRMPIKIELGDFLQLKPVNSIGLVDDLLAKNDDGSYVHPEITLEVNHACKLFTRIEHVFELKGTKRFVAGDPLIDFLSCMRTGTQFSAPTWKAFEKTWATDATGRLDPRHAEPKFRDGFGLAMYWETLSRWIPQRARRDARKLGVPLVFCQCYDECSTMSRDAGARFLNCLLYTSDAADE